MSEKGSVFQKGGGGTNFEQSIQAAFLLGLAIKGSAPCLTTNEIIEVSFQNTSRGFETDDLLVVTKSHIGERKLLMQIKHDVSFTENDRVFQEVLHAFWKDYSNDALFDKAKDKLIIVKGGLTRDERNHFKSIFNWANTHATEKDFYKEVDRIKAKKERLNIIRSILREANENVDLTKTQLWKFIKCMDVIEYDLLQAGSVDLAYFMNLIKLSKNKDTLLDDNEIWDSLLGVAARYNKDGGNITSESILKLEIYKNFSVESLVPNFKAIEKLKSDSDAIIVPLKDTIGDIHLTRPNISENIAQSIITFPITIVTGKPGVGKSAQVKDFLKKEFIHSSAFVFRADQFNQPHIANVFSDLGINISIYDIFSYLSLIPNKIIYLDSFEKLLEADPECAFKQLLGIMAKYPDIKLIASSRKYAIDLLILKFGLDKEKIGIVEIPLLSDEELNIVSFKYLHLTSVLSNEKIRPLLRSPKYLDFAIKALAKSGEDYTNIGFADFKNRLWNLLVVDELNEKNGLPIKRENAFMEIAIKRATEMKLFTHPSQADAEAITLLVKDEILIKEHLIRKYAPAHDILEDWALVKHISAIYEDVVNIEELFDKIGKEPSIRRAFRLWIEDLLLIDAAKVVELVKKVLDSSSIERYWTDEILTAVFRSEFSKDFFDGFEKDLLKGNSILLIRCMHIIRTCCKEYNSNIGLLLPVGSGWKELLLFIAAHIEQLIENKLSIVLFLSDWHFRLRFQYNDIEPDELDAAKSVVCNYIEEIESGKEFWQTRDLEDIKHRLVMILFDLAAITKEEIKKLVEHSFLVDDDHYWQIHSFYENVIKLCLSGLDNQRLINELPDLVIDCAWKKWKLRPVQPPVQGSIRALIGDNNLNEDDCWGIEDTHEFFPSGIYKTPLYNIFQYHPLKGLEFFVKFINYSIDFYVHAQCRSKYQIQNIEFEFPNGTKKMIWGSWELWVAYRGLSSTHNLLESLLMSFEKFLLETAAKKTETSRANIKFIFEYIYKNTNNIAPLGVLASVTMAYPSEVGIEMLPLLKIKEIYRWDLDRGISEIDAMSIADQKISFAQEERFKSNQLPHRRKFMRGFRDFIVDYQFNIRMLNKEIHQVFDELQSNILEGDIIWQKTITEIDIRNHKVGEYDENIGGFPIQPVYDKDVQEFMDIGKDEYDADKIAMNYSCKLQNAFDKKEPLNYADWTVCQNEYLGKESLNILFDRPVTLAVLGLRDMQKYLKKEEIEWCINTILNTAKDIIQDANSRYPRMNMNYNFMEKDLALSSFHLIFKFIEHKEKAQRIMIVMVHMLIAAFSEHELGKITKYIRDVFYEHYPKETKILWKCVVNYASFRKENPYFYDDHDTQRLQSAKEEEIKYVEEQINDVNGVLSIPTLTLDSHEGYLLTRALLLIPFQCKKNEYKEYIQHFILLVINDLKVEDDSPYRNKKTGRKLDFSEVLSIRSYMAELFILSDISFSKLVLGFILDESIKCIVPANNHRRKTELLEFTKDTLTSLVGKLDSLIANNSNDIFKESAIGNFWNLWSFLSEKIKESGNGYFVKQLLLDTGWKDEARDWRPLKGKKEIYYKLLKDFGASHAQSILNVISTIGETEFLPEAINWIADILKNNTDQLNTLMSKSAERLIQRIFYNYISIVKMNKELVNNYIYLLDNMIQIGSSNAYLFRENVITYKTMK